MDSQKLRKAEARLFTEWKDHLRSFRLRCIRDAASALTKSDPLLLARIDPPRDHEFGSRAVRGVGHCIRVRGKRGAVLLTRRRVR
jgi:hypothetical protein